VYKRQVIALLISIVAYIVLFFAKPEFRTSPTQSRRWSPVTGTVAGIFQGAIGVSGPIVGSWIHSLRLPRNAHILSVTLLFFVSGATQFVIFAIHGELSGRMLATVLACVPVLATIPIGERLRERVSSRGFDLATIGLLALSSIALCIRTLT